MRMFKNKKAFKKELKPKKETELEVQLTRIYEKLKKTEPETDEYAKLLERAEKLEKMKDSKNRIENERVSAHNQYVKGPLINVGQTLTGLMGFALIEQYIPIVSQTGKCMISNLAKNFGRR